jgi:hypothetical protein
MPSLHCSEALHGQLGRSCPANSLLVGMTMEGHRQRGRDRTGPFSRRHIHDLPTKNHTNAVLPARAETQALNFSQFPANVPCLLPAAPRRTVSILHLPYLDCMLNGVGMLSSQRINLTTLSMSVRQTTHAPTAVELSLLLSDVGVRVWCAYHLLLPLAMH